MRIDHDAGGDMLQVRQLRRDQRLFLTGQDLIASPYRRADPKPGSWKSDSKRASIRKKTTGMAIAVPEIAIAAFP
jgi:hypothetical protein